MAFKLITPVFHVIDISKSMNYYIEKLGFSFDFQVGDYAGLYNGYFNINLCGPGNQGQKKIPGNGHVYVECDDVESYYALVKSNGAIIITDLADRYYGMRDFALADPDGNCLSFGISLHE